MLFLLGQRQRFVVGFHLQQRTGLWLVIWNFVLVHNSIFWFYDSRRGRTFAGVCVQMRNKNLFDSNWAILWGFCARSPRKSRGFSCDVRASRSVWSASRLAGAFGWSR